MRLKSLQIDRQTWTPGQPLVGHIRFMDDSGEIQVNLDDAKCNEMLRVVADALVEKSKAIANDLTANILLAMPTMIEGPQ